MESIGKDGVRQQLFSIKYLSGSGDCNNKMEPRMNSSNQQLNQKQQQHSVPAPECDSTTTTTTTTTTTGFGIGEDVYYQEDDTGQNVLGTVSVIQGKKIKLIFMDETEKWTHVSRIKRITCSIIAEDDSVSIPTDGDSVGSTNQTISLKKKKYDVGKSGGGKESCQVTCGSCGTTKMITSKKAFAYSPFTTHQYNCRKCINKSKTTKNNGVVPYLPQHYLKPTGQKQANQQPNQSQSSSSTTTHHATTNTRLINTQELLHNGTSNSVLYHHHRAELPPGALPTTDICLHCRHAITEKVTLHCTMCERPCHPSCLAVTPPPMAGDVFWSIICQVCGTQQKPTTTTPSTDSHKLYSSRRSITCWSDVAYLLLSCMGCKNINERFFDIDKHIIPFWEENCARLHLPRQYKQTPPQDRRRSLLIALNNANLRFLKDSRTVTHPSQQPLFAIKDQTSYRCLLLQQQPQSSSPRPLTAAGFPIQPRPQNNPEATSMSMSTIAQTIAANKTTPTPKNSPILPPPQPNKYTNGLLLLLPNKPDQQLQPVAKKTAQTTSNIRPVVVHPHKKKRESTPPLQKQTNNLTPSPGGSARVSGVLTPSKSTTPVLQKHSNGASSSPPGSFPVRKNGSPIIMSKSIKVETVGTSNNRAPILQNRSLPVKRKLSPQPPSSPQQNHHHHPKLPSSTELTSKRLLLSNSPQHHPQTTNSPQPKQHLTPMQKLSDLQKHGGLTVACITSPTTTSPIQTTPTKPPTPSTSTQNSPQQEQQPPTHRPIRSKRLVTKPNTNQEQSTTPNKKPPQQQTTTTNKKSVTSNAAAALVNIAKSRGRPKKKLQLLSGVRRRPQEPYYYSSAHHQFNGAVVKYYGSVNNRVQQISMPDHKSAIINPTNQPTRLLDSLQPTTDPSSMIEQETFTWEKSTIQDLLRCGIGYRLSVLPRVQDSESTRELAVKYLQEELAPVPPSYWDDSKSKRRVRGRRGGKDLKDTGSYFVSGRRVSVGGVVEYQVVWGCGNDDDDEIGDRGEDDVLFQDYDYVEYFMDCLPVSSSSSDEVVQVKQERVDGELRCSPMVIDLTDDDST